jgi:hypothetical protein
MRERDERKDERDGRRRKKCLLMREEIGRSCNSMWTLRLFFSRRSTKRFRIF